MRYKPPPSKPKPWESPMVAKANELGGGDCSGVDLNRNWGYHWGATLGKDGKKKEGSLDPCSEVYMGMAAMTEPEVLAIAKYIEVNKAKVRGFLDVHTYSQKLLPPGCNGYPVPGKDAAKHLHTAQAIADAMSQGGAKYETGACTTAMYACAGTAADWTYGAVGVLHSYT